MRGGKAGLIDFCICRARWRNAEKRDWRYHVGGNSLRKHPRCIITLSAWRVIMLSFFTELRGKCQHGGKFNYVPYTARCVLEWPTMSPKENRKVRDIRTAFFFFSSFFLTDISLSRLAAVSTGSTYHQQYSYFMDASWTSRGRCSWKI